METLGQQELEQLWYVQWMDLLYDATEDDPEDMEWKIKSITSHCIQKQNGMQTSPHTGTVDEWRTNTGTT